MNTTNPTPLKLTSAQVLRETEKAFHIEVEIDSAIGRKGWKVWFPKCTKDGKPLCQIRDGSIFVSEWILGQKNNEIEATFRGGFYGIECSEEK